MIPLCRDLIRQVVMETGSSSSRRDEKSLTFGDDRIREAVEKYNAKLLILDPMSSYIGDTCSMNNANETRAEFNHLIAVARTPAAPSSSSPI